MDKILEKKLRKEQKRLKKEARRAKKEDKRLKRKIKEEEMELKERIPEDGSWKDQKKLIDVGPVTVCFCENFF